MGREEWNRLSFCTKLPEVELEFWEKQGELNDANAVQDDAHNERKHAFAPLPI